MYSKHPFALFFGRGSNPAHYVTHVCCRLCCANAIVVLYRRRRAEKSIREKVGHGGKGKEKRGRMGVERDNYPRAKKENPTGSKILFCWYLHLV